MNFVENWCECAWMVPLPFGTTYRYWFLSLDNERVCVCVCDRCVLAVKLTIDPTLIKCAVKLTLFVQFRWKFVWMCMNDSSLLRYQIMSHMLIQVLILVAGQCYVRVWSVWAVKLSLLTLDPTLIKCAVKLTLFIQFRWQLVCMCMNGSAPPRYQIISYMFMHTLDIYQNTAVCRTFLASSYT